MSQLSSRIVFGGAFDPVHFGHIKSMMELHKKLAGSDIYLLPCNQHPAKQVFADVAHRLAMLRLLTLPSQILIDEREARQSKPCYTIDTLLSIRQETGKNCSLSFVLGQDAWIQIHTWKDYLAIPEVAHLIVLVRRANASLPAVEDGVGLESHPLFQLCGGWSPWSEIHTQAAGKLFCLENPPIDISSTQIRQRIAQGKSLRFLMPAIVWKYIQYQHLYQASAISYV